MYKKKRKKIIDRYTFRCTRKLIEQLFFNSGVVIDKNAFLER